MSISSLFTAKMRSKAETSHATGLQFPLYFKFYFVVPVSDPSWNHSLNCLFLGANILGPFLYPCIACESLVFSTPSEQYICDVLDLEAIGFDKQ
ncbi:unnamed protein product [Camellia sinensis]